MNRARGQSARVDAHQTPQKALVHFDSRTAAMEVRIYQGLCNNSLAECTSPEIADVLVQLEQGWMIGLLTMNKYTPRPTAMLV